MDKWTIFWILWFSSGAVAYFLAFFNVRECMYGADRIAKQPELAPKPLKEFTFGNLVMLGIASAAGGCSFLVVGGSILCTLSADAVKKFWDMKLIDIFKRRKIW